MFRLRCCVFQRPHARHFTGQPLQFAYAPSPRHNFFGNVVGPVRDDHGFMETPIFRLPRLDLDRGEVKDFFGSMGRTSQAC